MEVEEWNRGERIKKTIFVGTQQPHCRKISLPSKAQLMELGSLCRETT